MFFHVDADEGSCIRGWLVLDNPTALPRIIVRAEGHPDQIVESTLQRDDVRDFGLHATGQVGFSINSDKIYNLSECVDVSIAEFESGLLIFRRKSDHHLQKKIFIFDSAVMPQQLMQRMISKSFTMPYFNTENNSLETMLVLINNKFSNSIAMWGRSNFGRYCTYLSNAEFYKIALLRDPFIELAERLMYINVMTRVSGQEISHSNLHGLEPLIPLAAALPFNDPKGMLPIFRSITPEQRQALSNPMTRILGCALDEQPHYRHVSVALDNLATFDVVGTRGRFELFRNMLTGVLGADPFGGVVPVEFETTGIVAHSLARVSVVVDLLEHDLALYSWAEEAIGNGSGTTS